MKKSKRVICIVMTLLTIFSCCSVASAAVDEYDHIPQVFVTGLGSAKIYYEDDPEQKSLFWPFEMERFIANLQNIPKYMLESVKNKEPNVVKTIIYNYLIDCFGMLALKPDGSNMDGVTVAPTVLAYDGDGKYTFYYDTRQAPTVTAPSLHDYIHLVMEETGSDKVELVGSSYGANVVTAYLDAYQDDLKHIDSILLCVPSVGGINFLGEILSGKCNVSAIGLCDYIHSLIDAELIPDFFYLMEETGILQIFLDIIAEPILRKALYEAIIEVARDAVATVPALWVCVPDEYFEEAMINMYGENYNSPDHTYAKLIKEMTRYHEIAVNAPELYTRVTENNKDLHFAIITKYGVGAIPLTDGPNTMDDSLVTVPVSSFGATCTTYKSKLPADYKQQKYTEYNFMSPGWDIDASTGIFPFTTWYISGLGHSKKNEDYKKFVDEIIYKDLTVFTDPNRPQYLIVSEENPELLIPHVAEDEKESLYDKLFEIFRKIVLFPFNIVKKITGKA